MVTNLGVGNPDNKLALDTFTLDNLNMTVQKASECPIRTVEGYYKCDDILILRNALLTERNLTLTKDNLVVKTSIKAVLNQGIQVLQPKIHETHQNSSLATPFKARGYETFIMPPLDIQEIDGLLQTLCFALASDIRKQQILFPFKMSTQDHWVTGQIIINKMLDSEVKISLTIHDSAGVYNYKEQLGNKLTLYLKNSLNMRQFWENKINHIDQSTCKKLDALFGTKERPINFTDHGISNIYPIQVSNVYCGGYTIRLIISLTQNPEQDITKLEVWQCERDDREMRMKDALVVAKYANPQSQIVYGSQSRGDEYRYSDQHRKSNEEQELMAITLGNKIGSALKKLSSEILGKIQERLEQNEIQIREKIAKDQKKTIDKHFIAYEGLKSLFDFCKNHLKIAASDNPLIYFYMFQKENLEHLTHQGSLNSAVVLEDLWAKFKEELQQACRLKNNMNIRLQNKATSHSDPEAILKDKIKSLNKVKPRTKEIFQDKVTLQNKTNMQKLNLRSSSLRTQENQQKPSQINMGGESRSEVIVSRQVIAVQQVKTLAINYQYANVETTAEKMAAKKAQAMSQLSFEKLPDLSKGDRHMKWHDSYESGLEKLLEKAKGRDSSREHEFTAEDLEDVVNCCSPEMLTTSVFNRNIKILRLAVFNRNIKILRLAVKILSYLAQNKRKLTPIALKVLVNKLDHPDVKVSFNVLIGLIYALHNGQDFSTFDEKTLIKNIGKRIRQLMNDHDAIMHIQIIAAGLSILAQKGEILEPDDFNQLRKSIAPLDQVHTSFFPVLSTPKKYAATDRMSWRRLPTDELRLFKKIVQSNSAGENALAERELKYAARQWSYEDKKKKRKSIKILRYAIQNGHRNFSEPKDIMKALQEASKDLDRKNKGNALIALGYLINSSGLANQGYKEQIPTLEAAMAETRYFAMNALFHYFRNHPDRGLLETPRWLKMLLPLQSYAYSDTNDPKLTTNIRRLAHHLVFKINGTVENMEDLLLDVEYSVNATYQLAESIEHKKLDDKTLNKIMFGLTKILNEPKYPSDAKNNCAVIVRAAAENGQPILRQTFKALVDYALKLNESNVNTETCYALGLHACRDSKLTVNTEALKLLFVVLQSKDEAQRQAAIFALRNIIDSLKKTRQEKEFSAIFGVAIKIIEQQDTFLEQSINLALFLQKAVQRQFLLPKEAMDKFAVILLRPVMPGEPFEKVKLILLDILKTMSEMNASLTFSEELLFVLASLLSVHSKQLQGNAFHLLLCHIKTCHAPIPQELVNRLANQLREPETSTLASELLKAALGKSNVFDTEVLLALAGTLTKENDLLTRLNAASIIDEIANRRSLASTVIQKLLLNLEGQENEVAESIVSALKRTSQLVSLSLLPDQAMVLANIVAGEAHSSVFRMNAAMILSHNSKLKNQRYLSRTLYMLANLLMGEHESELSRQILDILQLQMKQRHAVKNELWPEFTDITQNVEKLLQNEALIQETLGFLSQACKLGYSLTTKVAEVAAEVLLVQPVERRQLNEYACVILSSYEDRSLSKKAQDIKKLEQVGKILLPEKDSLQNIHQQKAAIESIKEIVKNCQFLTQNNLKTLENRLRQDRKLSLEILEILKMIAERGQKLNFDLLFSLSKIMLNLSYEPGLRALAIEIIALQAKKYDLPDALFDSFESIAQLNKDEEDKIHLDTLFMLELAARRGKKFDSKTIIRLIGFLGVEETAIAKATAQVLYFAARNQNSFHQFASKIMVQLERQKSSEIRRLMCLVIGRIGTGSNSMLEKKELDLLLEILAKETDLELEKGLHVFLSTRHIFALAQACLLD